jgi:hypothetical protein
MSDAAFVTPGAMGSRLAGRLLDAGGRVCGTKPWVAIADAAHGLLGASRRRRCTSI